MAPTIITPEDWGPFLWHMLYVIAIGMPPKPSTEEKAGFESVIAGLAQTLPCSICRNDFSKYVKAHPVATDSRDDMVSWVMGAHNDVRKRQGKTPLTSSDVQQMLVDNHARNKPSAGDLGVRYGVPLVCGALLGAGVVYWIGSRK